ncbi:MAG: DUF4396 domain-containing protein [Gammaproteobacteria bacterium]|nr:DUF4396 domain-containing protein [Gammaproteobacteria bacterium]
MNQHHQHGNKKLSTNQLAVSATMHCLTGCVIGEVIGLMLGVSLGWHPLQTAIVATALAFITGFALTLLPTFKQGLSLRETFKAVWLGETISIGVMEIVMNLVDYWIGGMNATSIAEPIFWISIGIAVVAGFAAGYPVNYFMLKKNLKQNCH